jgi:serine/threonine protein kinase
MCGTVEYMSPEVMNCELASPGSDLWGVGVITFQLLSGGISPFFAVNRFRTMAKVLEVDYSLDQVIINLKCFSDNFSNPSPAARVFKRTRF